MSEHRIALFVVHAGSLRFERVAVHGAGGPLVDDGRALVRLRRMLDRGHAIRVYVERTALADRWVDLAASSVTAVEPA